MCVEHEHNIMIVPPVNNGDHCYCNDKEFILLFKERIWRPLGLDVYASTFMENPGQSHAMRIQMT